MRVYIDKGSLWANGYVESFSGRPRDELLNRELSLSVPEWRNPLGYLCARCPDGAPTLEPDPASADLIRRGFEMVAAGIPQTEALAKLTRLGLRSVFGNPLTSSGLSKVLGNGVYAGWLSSPLVGPEPVRGNWSPIVSQELFERVQTVLARGDKREYMIARPDFPLKGFLQCACCGQSLTASWSTGRAGKRYAYYHCHHCGGVRGAKTAVETAFLDVLGGLRVASGPLRLFREVVLDVWRERSQHVADDLAVQQRLIANLQARKGKLLDLLLAETIEAETYAARVATINAKLKAARAEHLNTDCEDMDVEAVMSFAADLLRDPGKMWRAGSLAQRRRLQRFVFPDGVTWDGEKIGTVTRHRLFKELRPSEGLLEGVAPQTSRRNNTLSGTDAGHCFHTVSS